jgi:probable phosphoglycerate mutase
MKFSDMREHYPEFLKAWGSGSNAARMPGGESIDDVAERLESFVEELRCLDLPAVAVVSHNVITKLLLCDLMGLGRDGFRQVGADLGSITTLGIDRGRVSLHQLNDTCHLRHLETSHHPG